MNVIHLKLLLSISTVLTSIAIFLAYVISPYIASAYMMSSNLIGDDLPILTRDFVLPLMRVSLCENPFGLSTAPWVDLLWISLVLPPFGILLRSLRHSLPNRVILVWMAGMSVYLQLLVIIIILCVLGLIMPLACIM